MTSPPAAPPAGREDHPGPGERLPRPGPAPLAGGARGAGASGSRPGPPPQRGLPAASGLFWPARRSPDRSPLRHLDWILLVAVLALSLLGTLLVWAATEPKAGEDTHPYLMKQLLNIALGLAFMTAVVACWTTGGCGCTRRSCTACPASAC